MAVSFNLEHTLFLEKELAEKVKNFLLGGDNDQSHRFVKRSVSTSSEEDDPPDLRDPEKPAGVRDWEFSEQVLPPSDAVVEAPLGWLSQCYVITYNSFRKFFYILLLNQQRFALLTRSVSDDSQL
ncbi:hypothetical protein COOONC_17327 [Cooperia oncophora]